jgi:hypothetical protein
MAATQHRSIWRAVTFLVRLDMAAAILIAAALFVWLAWN